MDNCTLVNKLLGWHEPVALAGTWQLRPGYLEFVCKKLLLYVSGIREQIEAKTLPIFFIENIEFGVILIFVTLDVVIQIFYRFVLALDSRESLQSWALTIGGDTGDTGDQEQVGAQCRVRCGHRLFIFAR